ncbi:Mu transposase C-terminal domain-containing protein [Metapseudomonas boanensis]|uniref:Mu transposase C-terminal domain-containing protein n=1 Tax=Metapseudomonas boanensis TaxID=2822138 RepID=A0ABS5XI05_9GAMM|nr:Mu transposase C-terminal domain-containing protein [Pseudomonas boanensis]MBT8767328.1 Mu transposase C-terminal domain-containing protein [Pseudomonas boanensis]
MNNRLIQKGDLVEDNGQLFNVHDIRLQTDQVLLEGRAGNLVFYGVGEFNNRIAQGVTKPIFSRRAANEEAPTRELSLTEEAALKVRLDVLSKVKSLRENGVPWQDIGPMLGKQIPNIRTIQRWYAKYERVVNKQHVAPLYSARGNRGSKLSEVSEQALQEALLEFYKGTERFSIQSITELANARAKDICAELKLPFTGISRRSVTRAIYKIGNLESVQGRLGTRAANQTLHAALELLLIEAPYERVEYDSTVLNVHLVNDQGEVIGKPTLYLLIDCATGAIIAFYLTIQAESEEAFLRLLEMAFMPRDDGFLQRYGVKHALPAPALWHKMGGDNSAAHHGQGMYHALWYLGVANEFSQAGKPQKHPYVERTHGSSKTGLIKKLCGANLSEEVLEKDPEGRALREAALTLPQLEKLVARWICDVYMNRPLARLTYRFGYRCSPRQAMDALTKIYPLVPPPTPEEFREACLQYRSKKVSLTSKGVVFDTFHYNSQELYELFLAAPRKSKVEIRWHPLDVSAISVVSPLDQKVMITVPNKLRNLPPMSFGEAKQIRRKLYKSDAELTEEDYHQAAVELYRDIHALNKAATVAKRKRAARASDKQLQTKALQATKPVHKAEADAPATLDLQALTPVPTRK